MWRQFGIFIKEIDSIESFHDILSGEQKFMPLSPQEGGNVRSIIGSLQWSAIANGPDLSYHPPWPRGTEQIKRWKIDNDCQQSSDEISEIRESQT